MLSLTLAQASFLYFLYLGNKWTNSLHRETSFQHWIRRCGVGLLAGLIWFNQSVYLLNNHLEPTWTFHFVCLLSSRKKRSTTTTQPKFQLQETTTQKKTTFLPTFLLGQIFLGISAACTDDIIISLYIFWTAIEPTRTCCVLSFS